MSSTRSHEAEAEKGGGGHQAHSQTWAEVIESQRTDSENGLTESEAESRLTTIGKNELDDFEQTSAAEVLLRQAVNAMNMILILAMAVSFGIKAWIEAGVLAAVVILNITIGFTQEMKARKVMSSLKSLSSPVAAVIRDGKHSTIPTTDIVPGDIVELKVGDLIPADIRLIEVSNFETDEALLTGESLPIRKEPDSVFDPATGPGDRLNVAFSSSTVCKGRAKGVVFATAMTTEIGSIAAALRTKEVERVHIDPNAGGFEKFRLRCLKFCYSWYDWIGQILGINIGTPLQRKLSWLAIYIFFTAIVCAIIVLAANEFSDRQEVIVYAVAVGISMIPSSLVVVLTITMTVGTKRMVKRNVIVRDLNSLEALGAVTDICSDKTGTLTQGKMVAQKAWIPSLGTLRLAVSNEPFNPTVGELYHEESPPVHISLAKMNSTSAQTVDFGSIGEKDDLKEFLKAASLANLAIVEESEPGKWEVRGDPTEIAIQVFTSRFNWNRAEIVSRESPAWQQLEEFPFDSTVKKMSTVFLNTTTGEEHLFTKGAVERVISSCTSYHPEPDAPMKELTDEFKSTILASMDALASYGLRVLAVASRTLSEPLPTTGTVERNDLEKDLVFRGLIGLYDPPRPESALAVQHCFEAGIAVHMLTGDHPTTARSIAADIGIIPRRMGTGDQNTTSTVVMTADRFDALSDEQIDALDELPLVIARCSPGTKVRMIEALHRREKFVAMTGDGVNDAPSLKSADIGIAMGINGSDVAKDASDIILTDDNFASIVNAIEEGRRMFDNIQKFVLHILSLNLAQALILMIGLVFKDEEGFSIFPLSPVEIVWLVMVTTALPDMGLGFEQAAIDILQRPPRNLKMGLWSWEMLADTVFYGLWIALLVLSAFALVLDGFGDRLFGINCNNEFEGCGLAFRARGTAWVCLSWFLCFEAWELVDSRRSFFNMRPSTSHSWLQFTRDVWKNRFLFWSVISGFILVFPLLYIPVINTKVFKHSGLGYEWGIAFIATLLFFLGAEFYKWCKRAYFRRPGKQHTGIVGPIGIPDLEEGDSRSARSGNGDVEKADSNKETRSS